MELLQQAAPFLADEVVDDAAELARRFGLPGRFDAFGRARRVERRVADFRSGEASLSVRTNRGGAPDIAIPSPVRTTLADMLPWMAAGAVCVALALVTLGVELPGGW